MRRLRHVALGTCLVTLAACGADPVTPTPKPPASTTITTIFVVLPSQILTLGVTAQAWAQAQYSDGHFAALSATWTSTNGNVLAVTPTGVVTALAVGSADIIATVGSFSGRQGAFVVAPGGDDQQFRVAIMMNTGTPPAEADINRVFGRANDLLQLKTHERMRIVDRVDVGRGDPRAFADSYIQNAPTLMSDGILAISDDALAVSAGGWSTTLTTPPSFANLFPAPGRPGNREYLNVLHFEHLYGRCGYNDAGVRIGGFSGGGECRGISGVECVNNGHHWQCPDTINDLYSDPDYFAGSTIVHEFMHGFGSAGNDDHYGTDACMARTGMNFADAHNTRFSQENYGMCPDVFLKFRHGG